MEQGEFTQYSFAATCELQQHLAPVLRAALAVHQPPSFQAVHQFDRTVMLNLQALGNSRDFGTHIARQTLEGEEKLVLTRFQTGSASGSFTEPQEAANPV